MSGIWGQAVNVTTEHSPSFSVYKGLAHLFQERGHGQSLEQILLALSLRKLLLEIREEGYARDHGQRPVYSISLHVWEKLGRSDFCWSHLKMLFVLL